MKELKRQPFDILDAYNEECYLWANTMMYFCQEIEHYDIDILSYTFMHIANDYMEYALGIYRVDLEDADIQEALDMNFEELLDKMQNIRSEIAHILQKELGDDVLIRSFEIISESPDPDYPGEHISSLSQDGFGKTISFVQQGFTW